MYALQMYAQMYAQIHYYIKNDLISDYHIKNDLISLQMYAQIII